MLNFKWSVVAGYDFSGACECPCLEQYNALFDWRSEIWQFDINYTFHFVIFIGHC